MRLRAPITVLAGLAALGALAACGTATAADTATPAATATTAVTAGAPTPPAPTTGMPATTAPPAPEPPTTTVATITVTRVVDGDTLDLSTGQTVRIIGIDTPEVGRCGAGEAAQRLTSLVTAMPITLEAGARADTDKYGRILRYVSANGVDVGLDLIQHGLAIARYDSRDGYGLHPRQAGYVAADAATPSTCPPATTVAPATPATTPAVTDETVVRSSATGPYVNCTEARGAGAAPLHRGEAGYASKLDRDGDGVACE